MIGSTGSHYNVELKDPAPSCQCVDYRIRRRICKHQKLVLLQLGIPDQPQDWYKVWSPHSNVLADIVIDEWIARLVQGVVTTCLSELADRCLDNKLIIGFAFLVLVFVDRGDCKAPETTKEQKRICYIVLCLWLLLATWHFLLPTLASALGMLVKLTCTTNVQHIS